MTGARIGDYRLGAQLAADEVAATFLATHVVLPRKVTLAVVHADAARVGAVRLIREACLLEALAHPCAPRVYECGVLPDRRAWAAYELVVGASLANTTVNAPLAIADLVVIVRDVADLLDHAHARGVVHRALTADALVHTPDRVAPVLVRGWRDARTVDAAGGERVDPRDDVGALGAVAFRALVGCDPDGAMSAAERCPHGPHELTALIDHMLAADPAARPTSADVRDRAAWLADTLAPRALTRPRWTPPRGLRPDAMPAPPDEPAGFSITITRTRSSLP